MPRQELGALPTGPLAWELMAYDGNTIVGPYTSSQIMQVGAMLSCCTGPAFSTLLLISSKRCPGCTSTFHRRPFLVANYP